MLDIRVCDDDPDLPAFASGGADVVISGPANEPFLRGLARQFGQRLEGSKFCVQVGENELYTPIVVDEKVTFEQVAGFLGSESLHIDSVARGGVDLALLGDVVNAGLTLLGLWEAGLKVDEVMAGRRFTSQRQRARRWVEEGAPARLDLELLQEIKAEREWTLERFGRTFGLSIDLCVRLLRCAGYRREKDLGKVIWRDQTD